jgi:hypothetical protein
MKAVLEKKRLAKIQFKFTLKVPEGFVNQKRQVTGAMDGTCCIVSEQDERVLDMDTYSEEC